MDGYIRNCSDMDLNIFHSINKKKVEVTKNLLKTNEKWQKRESVRKVLYLIVFITFLGLLYFVFNVQHIIYRPDNILFAWLLYFMLYVVFILIPTGLYLSMLMRNCGISFDNSKDSVVVLDDKLIVEHSYSQYKNTGKANRVFVKHSIMLDDIIKMDYNESLDAIVLFGIVSVECYEDGDFKTCYCFKDLYYIYDYYENFEQMKSLILHNYNECKVS